MRRLFAACGLLLAILAGCLCNSWYMGRFTAGLVRSLGQAQQAARAGDWTRAGETTLQAYEGWESHRLYLHVVARHGDADQILRTFRSVLQYLDIREMDQYAAANADLMVQLELLSEMEQASLGNVF